jgi:hypothetical protein
VNGVVLPVELIGPDGEWKYSRALVDIEAGDDGKLNLDVRLDGYTDEDTTLSLPLLDVKAAIAALEAEHKRNEREGSA